MLAPVAGDPPTRVFVVDKVDDAEPAMALLRKLAPAIKSESDWAGWNRPGAFELRRDGDGELVLRVDPTMPTVYGDVREFTGSTGSNYRNLIYRVHFERVPHQFKPFHITAGLNGGLFFIITVDDDDQPLLLTTLHSCGCYLAFLPTDRLPANQLPDGWSPEQQTVFEQTLPGLLRLPDNADSSDNSRLVITLRDGTHRVADVVFDMEPASAGSRAGLMRESLAIRPLSELDSTAVIGGGTASVFDEDDYLRSAGKPLEAMLMSWWALDRHVGVDKRLGRNTEQGNSFYTSLKPWHRQASDMRDFGSFLDYWGFKL